MTDDADVDNDDDNAEGSVNNKRKKKSPRFSRHQFDPQLYHGVAPENMRYIHEDDEQQTLSLVMPNQQQEESKATLSMNAESDDPFAEFRGIGGVSVGQLAANGPHLAGDRSSPSELLQEVKHIKDRRADAFLHFSGEQSRRDMLMQQRDAEQGPNRNDGGLASGKSANALAAERRLLQVLESNAEDKMKADAAVSMAAELRRDKLPLRARVAEDVFSLWARLSTDDFTSKQNQLALSPSAGEEAQIELSSYVAISYLEPMASVYFYLRANHTAPTPQLLEHYMTVLSMCASIEEIQKQQLEKKDASDDYDADENSSNELRSSTDASSKITTPFHVKIMSLAHRAMLDTDRFCVLPTRITLTSYFDICGMTANMDIALVRFADVKQNLFLEPDGGMVRAIVSGLCRNGLVSESLAFLARVSAVHVDISFVNSTLSILVLSDEPMSAFAAFRAMQQSGVVPNTGTFYHLLRACEASGQWDAGVPFVLAEMQRLKVKGDDATLSLLLKGLLIAHGMQGYAQQLYLAMKQKGVAVFAAAEEAMPERVQKRGQRLLLAAAAAADGELPALHGDSQSSSSSARYEERKHRKQEAEMNSLAARGAFLNNGNDDRGMRRADLPPVTVLTAYALRKKLGSVAQQEEMEQLLALKQEFQKSKQSDDATPSSADGGKTVDVAVAEARDRFHAQSRAVRPLVLKLLHKHFFGVAPVSTRVIDGAGAGGGRKKLRQGRMRFKQRL